LANKLNNLNFTLIARSAPNSGPTSSDAWNDSFFELATDLSSIANEWNNKLVPVFDTLPKGELDTAVNVFQSGLDGKTVWVDSAVVSSDTDLTFFNTARQRPATIKEAFLDLYQHVTNQLDQLTTTILDAASGLTTDQKNRIGANIFDAVQTSSSNSLDGRSERNRLNIIQLAADMYGAGYVLANNGNAQLTNSLFAMVDALLELHNGNWSDDISLNHTGAFTATQSDIGSSAPGSDTFSGSPLNLGEDLDQIRTEIKNTKGVNWRATLPNLYTGGASTLNGLLASTKGSGTKTASNPWGYQYNDLDGLVTRLDAIRDFTGQSSHTDASPTYLANNYINDGDSLELAIGELDTGLALVANIEHAFTDLTDTPISLSGANSQLLRVNSVGTGLEFVAFSHANASDLDADDHTQYLLLDGFSG
jgi:hypothetical protein